MLIVAVLCLIAFIAIIKFWIFGVKVVGTFIIEMFKPVYKFMLRLCPVTVVMCSLIFVIIVFGMITSAINGNDDKTEETIAVDETDEEAAKFVEDFLGRAEGRMMGFANFIMKNTDMIYKVLGANENGEMDGPVAKVVIVVALVYIFLPFVILLLILIFIILALLEFFVITLVIDLIIFIIRCIVYRSDIWEKVSDWWDWATD